MLDLLDSRASRMSMSVAMRSQCLKICLPTFESSMHTPISSVLSMSTTRSCGRSFVSLFVNWSGYTLCLSDTLPIFSTSAWARISWQTLTSWLLKVCTQWPGLYCTHIYVQYTLKCLFRSGRFSATIYRVLCDLDIFMCIGSFFINRSVDTCTSQRLLQIRY